MPTEASLRQVAVDPGTGPLLMLWGELQTVMQSALGSYASTGLAVNSATALRTLEATFFLAVGTCEEMDKRRRASVRARQGAVLGLELALDTGEDGKCLIEHRVIVGGHYARAQQRPPGGTAGCSAVLTNTPPS